MRHLRGGGGVVYSDKLRFEGCGTLSCISNTSYLIKRSNDVP